jgi:2-hydroxy-6-oxonona-2,4-dienedioate hydrolase
MNKSKALTLNNTDPLVIAARNAEQQLFDFYGLKAKTHEVPLTGLGIKMRISEIGTGEPVLIVPGNTGDSFPLAPLLAELEGRRLIVLNRPGGGLSEGMDHSKVNFREFAVKTLTAVLDAFGLERVPIIAHSIGGHWSLWMAMDKPERVSALVLLGVPGNIINTGPPFAMRLLSVPILNKILFSLIIPRSPKESLRGLSFMGHSPEVLAHLPEAMADCYYHFQHLPHYQVSSLSLMEQGGLFAAKSKILITAEQLKKIQQPVMFLWGTNDPFGSADTGRKIAALIPVSEFNPVPNGGHLPWLDDPAGCGEKALKFLANHQ